MSAINLDTLTISSAREALDRGDFSAQELTREILKRIEEKDIDIKAFLEVYPDVLLQAEEADARIQAGTQEALTGIPIALKDNILREGFRVSASSKILENYVAPYSATVVKKLIAQNAVLVGRTNCDEFAMGSSTENSAYQYTKNPRDISRVPGGSSGGSAAAVASGMVLGAYGSDTGGSIRQPASFCGVVGLKPTYGSVSRYGLIAMGSSLDVIGPFAKTVEDTELLFNAVRGEDENDSTTLPQSTYSSFQKKESYTIGVPRAFIEQGLENDVKAEFEKSLKALIDAGNEVVDIDLPHTPKSLATYYIIMSAEVSTNLARFDGVKYGLHKEGESVSDEYKKTRTEGFGKEVKRRILLGSFVLSSGYYDAYYGKAVVMREMIKKEFVNTFQTVDAIALPTTPGPAFRFGEKTNNPLSMYLEDIFTVPANIAGIPGISIPAGEVEREGVKLPLGLQLLASHTREDVLFTLGAMRLREN